jgi:hypothetical protein
MTKKKSSPHSEVYMTFMGWVEKGRGVKTGEKAVAFVDLTIDGTTKKTGLFSQSQTIKLKLVYPDPQADWDNYWKRDGYFGYDSART